MADSERLALARGHRAAADVGTGNERRLRPAGVVDGSVRRVADLVAVDVAAEEVTMRRGERECGGAARALRREVVDGRRATRPRSVVTGVPDVVLVPGPAGSGAGGMG